MKFNIEILSGNKLYKMNFKCKRETTDRKNINIITIYVYEYTAVE